MRNEDPLKLSFFPVGACPSPSPRCVIVAVPPHSNSIALCNQVIQVHMNIRKCRNHGSIKLLKFLRSSNHRGLLGQTVRFSALGEHLRDSFLALPVPDFLKHR